MQMGLRVADRLPENFARPEKWISHPKTNSETEEKETTQATAKGSSWKWRTALIFWEIEIPAMKLPSIYHPQPPYEVRKTGVKPYCFLNTHGLGEKSSKLLPLIGILRKCP